LRKLRPEMDTQYEMQIAFHPGSRPPVIKLLLLDIN